MRGCGQKRLVEAAGGLKALMPLHPVLWAGVCFSCAFGFVAGCGLISKVVHIGKVLCCLPHSSTPLPDQTVA